jgi:hypothetical protein
MTLIELFLDFYQVMSLGERIKTKFGTKHPPSVISGRVSNSSSGDRRVP